MTLRLTIVGCGSLAELNRSFLELPDGWPAKTRL